MTRRLYVEIPGPVVGAQRVRATKTGNHVRMYSAPAHVEAEARIVLAVGQVWAGRPALDAPVLLVIQIWAARPGRLRRVKDRGTDLRATGKPDLDNVAKLVMDAMTRAGVWVDDTRVCHLTVERWYAPLGKDGEYTQVPRMILQVWA